jgi:hypothetical protein
MPRLMVEQAGSLQDRVSSRHLIGQEGLGGGEGDGDGDGALPVWQYLL